MSPRRTTTDAPAPELEALVRTLPGVLERLRESYGALERRARRVELELRRAQDEKDELREQLHAADKLAALGTMAAGIAHEIRNPLNAVKGFAELLMGAGLADERLRRWAENIVAGVHEVDQIIDNMLSFASPERLRLEPVDGSELLESAARLARNAAQHAAGHEALVLRCEVEGFLADRIKLRQAARNLIENALEAQGEHGVARVEVGLTREGSELVLRVADAGPGVPAELRRKILDPFFTTHADGTGLGLALVATIARLHGGSVQVAPRPSALGGALFELRIPFQPVSEPTRPLSPQPRG
jgi:signal transduction histidine kinase